MGLRKEKKLRTSFIQFVVALGLFMIVLVLINYMLLVVSSLIVYPANYSERMIQHNFETLKEAEQVTGDLLTPMSSFGVYTDNGEFLYGNFLEKDTNKMWTKYNKGEKSAGSRNYMTSIKREEGVLLIKYPLTMQYKTDKLRSLLLNPEATGVILFIIELILGIVSLSNRFAKNIDKELESLLVAAGKIEEGDLESL